MGVGWEHYAGVEARTENVAARACAAIESVATSTCDPEPAFYVGVSRYVGRRWLGGDNLAPENAHGQKWRRMCLLAAYAVKIGDAEDKLITALRKRYGNQRCANLRGGGGGASPYKPSILYLCVGRSGWLG